MEATNISFSPAKELIAPLSPILTIANLGQLTAGIAHKIKNPLNFVINISDISTELIDEVFEEYKKDNTESTQQEIQ